MPAKRRVEAFDPLASDPDDSDFSAHGETSRKSRKSKSRRSEKGKPKKKRQRQRYSDNDDDEEDSDEDISESDSQESFEDESEEEQELQLNSRGRPVRKAVQAKNYEESDDDDDEENDERERRQDQASDPRPKNRKELAESLIVKLKVGLAEGALRKRRSGRIQNDDGSNMYALTTSGNHAEVVRPGTRSPEPVHRTRVAGKGPKKAPEVIEEASVETSRMSNGQTQEGDELHEYEGVEHSHAHPPSDLAMDIDAEDAAEDLNDEADPLNETNVVPESEDESDRVITRTSRRAKIVADEDDEDMGAMAPATESQVTRRSLRSARDKRKKPQDQTSDFEIEEDEEDADEDMTDSEKDRESPTKGKGGSQRRSTRNKRQANSDSGSDDEDQESLTDELQDELAELNPRSSRRKIQKQELAFQNRSTRTKKPVNYNILSNFENALIEENDDAAPAAVTPRRRGGNYGWTTNRSLFSISGPFGGMGGPRPVLGGPSAHEGVDSDSSDEENQMRHRPSVVGGAVGMTPTMASAPGFPAPLAVGADPITTTLGKVTNKKALADADPLGVDLNVNFDSVGGLDDYINQLKEMVMLPLLYPEVFLQFKTTPPRGVLFHGPPGTGKTLMARALASSVTSFGKKVTFYMRKGADSLSKWVGEAERQLRILFEDARKNQPSIIFFDEIDGLAPVRSSKQEQIHSSMVSTLLALMDGMDGRGQVIVIGATNRPDNVDPALRRPGRFDREFYFPLPSKVARKKIIDIHTSDWKHPPSEDLKNELSEMTKGYGGADLRALCTEATLNATQRRYPQIYTSNEKREIDPNTIRVTAKDFIISVRKIIPSSLRSAASLSAPLPKNIEPLLRRSLAEVSEILKEVLPQKKPTTALDEAMYEDAIDDRGMAVERMQQEFERLRVFRPRLLVRGTTGMGQQHLSAAVLDQFEGVYVQSFDLAALVGDPSRSAAECVVQFFAEVKSHKPSVIYIPNVNVWYQTLEEKVITTFLGLLRSLNPTDPILLLGVLDCREDEVDPDMVRTLFGHSKRNQYILSKPDAPARSEFLSPIVSYINMSPKDFPDPTDRKKRVLEELPIAQIQRAATPPPPSEAELKAAWKNDLFLLQLLKTKLIPIMDQIRVKFRKFRNGVVDDNTIRYLYEEEDPDIVQSDLPIEQQDRGHRPFEKVPDGNGEMGLRHTETGRFYYNMDTVTIEKRLANGYYKRPDDFLHDIKKLEKDARVLGDEDRIMKASELSTNVEVDMITLERTEPGFVNECQKLYEREKRRETLKIAKALKQAEKTGQKPEPIVLNIQPNYSPSNPPQSGPLTLGSAQIDSLKDNVMHFSTPTKTKSHVRSGSNEISDLSRSPRKPDSNSTNGVGGTSDDVHMAGTDDSPSTERDTLESVYPSAQQTVPEDLQGGPSSLQARLSQPDGLSQRSAMTSMAKGSSVQMYKNSASTTSSDKTKTTPSSGKATTLGESPLKQQMAANDEEHPEPGHSSNATQLSLYGSDSLHRNPYSQNSQDATAAAGHGTQTQLTPIPHGTQHSPPSQRLQNLPPVPPFDEPSRPKSTAPSSSLSSNNSHNTAASQFLEYVVRETSFANVEQLEQIYSALMNELWRTRSEWNRDRVVDSLMEMFVDTVSDIKDCQEIGEPSFAPLGDSQMD